MFGTTIPWLFTYYAAAISKTIYWYYKEDLAELIKGGEWNDNNSYNNILIKENT